MNVDLARGTTRRVRNERRIRREWRTSDQDLGGHYGNVAMDKGGLYVVLGVPQDAWSLLS